MSISVNRDKCEGYGLCAQAAPDLIALDDEGDPQIGDPDLTSTDIEKARSAARACPIAAIQIL